MSDLVVESMQEDLNKVKKDQRKLFLYRCSRRQPGNTERALKVTSCRKMSGNGFHLQTRGRTTNSYVNLGTAKREHGGLKVTHMRNGSLLVQAHSYGSTESVRIPL
jgi:hypothetical protein